MREIKFRGYQPELKKWVYGNLIVVPNWSSFIFSYEKNFEDRIKVDSDSVRQCTGLKDSKGTEIYEGDVLQSIASDGSKIQHEVRYEESEARFVCFHVRKYPEPSDVGMSINQHWINEFKKEVIGNIYANPELLTK